MFLILKERTFKVSEKVMQVMQAEDPQAGGSSA
jgi:hypothetical protein